MSKLTIAELESIVASLGGIKPLATSQSETGRMVRDLLEHYELRSRVKRSLINGARSTASHLRDVADRLDAGGPMRLSTTVTWRGWQRRRSRPLS